MSNQQEVFVSKIQEAALKRLNKLKHVYLFVFFVGVAFFVFSIVLIAVFSDDNGDLRYGLNVPVIFMFPSSFLLILLAPLYSIGNKRAQKIIKQYNETKISMQTARVDTFNSRKYHPECVLFDQSEVCEYLEKLEGFFIAYRIKKVWPVFLKFYLQITKEDDIYLFCSEQTFSNLNNIDLPLDNEAKQLYAYFPKRNVVLAISNKPKRYVVNNYGVLAKYKAKH